MASSAFSAAKIVGLTGAAWLSGTIAAISLISIPAVSRTLKEDNLSAAHAVKLWRNNFEAGFALAPPIALATASSLASCGWAARNLRTSGVKDGRLFWVAAALTVSIVPYTIIFMKSTNDKLLRYAKKEKLTTSESQETEGLLKRWVFLNSVRSLLPLAGALLTSIVVLA
ncbi:DUF1772-domain-containing protein [Macroventuria anomochaeta]|uniref:DUF1772-domain-containing protein n=1 Tax=Macroventuria anomochaeta TaxID=301207 RepID=A0ACB6S1L0_9PLEO|nr:DUF1772-domain-containing protein [Macroventuria anomochaeta]KAF2627857.1 DUF1772-domain-containing protein [Macroventuria anomochaeta]